MKRIIAAIALVFVYSVSAEEPVDSHLPSGQPAVPGERQLAPVKSPPAKIVEFHLKGKGMGPWNEAQKPLTIPVGTTLRIVNDDTIVHQLHALGQPCDHSDPIEPGDHYDCGPVTKAMNPGDATLYDHNYGRTARFYLKVTEK